MAQKLLLQPADIFRMLDLSCRKLATWWLSEVQLLFPHASMRAVRDKQSVLMITLRSNAVSCHLNLGLSERRTDFPADDFGDAKLDQWLLDAGTAPARTTVGFGLDQSLFFVRDLVLPRAALPALQRILDQDLVRRTPFDPSSIWHCGTEGEAVSADVASIRHWIVRRDLVEAALQQAGLSANTIDFLAVTDGSGNTLGTIAMRQVNAPEPPWVRRAVQLLAVLAIMVFVSCIGIIVSVQSRTADRLDEELAAARQSIGAAKGGMLSKLLLQKAEAPVAAVWDELSQILPGDTHLGDLRIADGKIVISGYSKDAPGLVNVIGRSNLFEQVSLVGAIVPNTAEGKDQFKISFAVRRSPAAKLATFAHKTGS